MVGVVLVSHPRPPPTYPISLPLSQILKSNMKEELAGLKSSYTISDLVRTPVIRHIFFCLSIVWWGWARMGKSGGEEEEQDEGGRGEGVEEWRGGWRAGGMDDWRDGWKDGWMVQGWMVGWKGRWTDGWRVGRMYGWLIGKTDSWTISESSHPTVAQPSSPPSEFPALSHAMVTSQGRSPTSRPLPLSALLQVLHQFLLLRAGHGSAKLWCQHLPHPGDFRRR